MSKLVQASVDFGSFFLGKVHFIYVFGADVIEFLQEQKIKIFIQRTEQKTCSS